MNGDLRLGIGNWQWVIGNWQRGDKGKRLKTMFVLLVLVLPITYYPDQ